MRRWFAARRPFAGFTRRCRCAIETRNERHRAREGAEDAKVSGIRGHRCLEHPDLHPVIGDWAGTLRFRGKSTLVRIPWPTPSRSSRLRVSSAGLRAFALLERRSTQKGGHAGRPAGCRVVYKKKNAPPGGVFTSRGGGNFRLIATRFTLRPPGLAPTTSSSARSSADASFETGPVFSRGFHSSISVRTGSRVLWNPEGGRTIGTVEKPLLRRHT